MIEPVEKGTGRVSLAKATCDKCGREETFTCDYARFRRHDGSHELNTGQAKSKLQGMGWQEIKGKNFCPACVAKRKALKVVKTETKPEPVETPREPTRKQRREIMAMLGEVYDADAECYTGGDTDDTVADVLGVMPGWVSEIREEFFGPDGGNEDMSEIVAEIQKHLEQLTALEGEIANMADRVRKDIAYSKKLAADLDRVMKAVGARNVKKAGLTA